jgi:hypothetical protein
MQYRNLLFLHIPKAAGTTLHSILEQHYAPSSQYSIFDPDQKAKEFAGLPTERREPIRLLKGHIAYGLHQSLIGETTYITLLRDPVARVISHYYYVRGQPTHYLYGRVMERRMSLREYASSNLTDELDNGQTRLLAGIESDRSVPIGACDANLLNIAKHNIERHFSLAGLSERFDESLALMAIMLGWDWTPSYRNLNVSTMRAEQGRIDASTRKCIEQANPLDVELYAWAKQRFDALIVQHRDEVDKRVGNIHDANRAARGPVSEERRAISHGR